MASADGGFEFLLNELPVRVLDALPQATLLQFIRSRGLTGAKEGCAEGECGACAVLFVRPSVSGTVFQPVNSCLVPLPAAAGQEVYTIEALAEAGQLAEVQKAMATAGGSQCGYCTPGFVVSMFAEQHRRENRPADIHALSGNLCRCTGYRPIGDALLGLGPPAETPLKVRLERPAPAMRPVSYGNAGGYFSRPCDLQQCLQLASENGARLVAGNTDLGVLTNLRDERFAHLISLEGVPELREFVGGPDCVEIGAGLTLTEIAERWTGAPAVISEWLNLFASPLIRNRATLGGNLATASPIGDSAPLLLALGAEVRIAGIEAERIVPLAEFFRGYRETALTKNEVVRSVRIPKPLPSNTRFFKAAKRGLDDISTAAIGIAQRGDQWVIGLGGMGPTPIRVIAKSLDEAEAAIDALRPLSDHRGSAAYRSAVTKSLLRRFELEHSA